ncbi:hypothetical protein JHV666_49080 [Mycobacterium avium subsp. hominissuis]
MFVAFHHYVDARRRSPAPTDYEYAELIVRGHVAESPVYQDRSPGASRSEGGG